MSEPLEASGERRSIRGRKWEKQEQDTPGHNQNLNVSDGGIIQ
jgi:hypothetical protein